MNQAWTWTLILEVGKGYFNNLFVSSANLHLILYHFSKYKCMLNGEKLENIKTQRLLNEYHFYFCPTEIITENILVMLFSLSLCLCVSLLLSLIINQVASRKQMAHSHWDTVRRVSSRDCLQRCGLVVVKLEETVETAGSLILSRSLMR